MGHYFTPSIAKTTANKKSEKSSQLSQWSLWIVAITEETCWWAGSFAHAGSEFVESLLMKEKEIFRPEKLKVYSSSDPFSDLVIQEWLLPRVDWFSSQFHIN